MKKLSSLLKYIAVTLLTFSIAVSATTPCQAALQLKKFDEQRAVNLNADNLEKWGMEFASVKKWDKSRDPNFTFKYWPYYFSDGHEGRVYLYMHKDIGGNRWKGLVGAGKTAVALFAEGVKESLLGLPMDVLNEDVKNLKDARKKVIDDGAKNATTDEAIYEIISSAAESMSGDYPYVYCTYYYYDLKKPAVYANVVMSAVGREKGYNISRAENDAETGGRTKGGYSLKPDSLLNGYPGYYYDQNIITINNDRYWEISIFPTWTN